MEPLHGAIGPSSASETGESRLASLCRGPAIEFFLIRILVGILEKSVEPLLCVLDFISDILQFLIGDPWLGLRQLFDLLRIVLHRLFNSRSELFRSLF